MDGRRTVNPLWTCVCKQVRFLPPAFWEYVVTGNQSVSKTDIPGSNPGTPVNVCSYLEAWRNWQSHWFAKPGSYYSLVWVRVPPPLSGYF